MNQSPQTIGYALADSPVAMAAYYYDKFAEWTDSNGEPEKVLTYDEMLDAISIYWLTNTGTSSSRSYWEGAQAGGGPFDAFDIPRSEEHTSELQSLMRISYAVFCLKKKTTDNQKQPLLPNTFRLHNHQH